MRIEAAVEADHQRGAGLLDHRQASSTRAASRSIGFSQKIALPALAKRSIRSAWVSVGVQITTASISSASSIASMLRTSAP